MLTHYCTQINEANNTYYNLKLETITDLELQFIYNSKSKENVDKHISTTHKEYMYATEIVQQYCKD